MPGTCDPENSRRLAKNPALDTGNREVILRLVSRSRADAKDTVADAVHDRTGFKLAVRI